MAARRNERPLKRTNPGGDIVWVARWTDKTGRRRIGWPPDIKGTHKLKRQAQDAITACYDREAEDMTPTTAVTVGGYFGDDEAGWLRRHPRSERTARSYRQRVGYVLDVQLSGCALRDWSINDVTREQANDLVDHMLRVQGRAADGARGVVRVLSAMWADAIDDQKVKRGNPFLGLVIRSSDPRVTKAPRRRLIWTWEQMHAFAAAAARPIERDITRVPAGWRAGTLQRWQRDAEWRTIYAEPMLRTLSDVGGLRLGELPGLERTDVKLGARCDEQGCAFVGPHLHIRRTAHAGVVSDDGTKTDHGEADPGRAAPIPPVVAGMLERLPRRIDTPLLFPTPRGRCWAERNFYRDVWYPTQKLTGLACVPQEFRHSYVSLMRAAGVDPADLAAWTGHTVLTATKVYTHSTGASAELARRAVGT